MKRVGLSLGLSLVAIGIWALTAGLLLAFVFPDSEEVARIFAAPMAFFPELIFPAGFLPLEDDYPLGLIAPTVIDLDLLAIPIYGVLTILAKRKPRTFASPNPPPPPTFND